MVISGEGLILAVADAGTSYPKNGSWCRLGKLKVKGLSMKHYFQKATLHFAIIWLGFALGWAGMVEAQGSEHKSATQLARLTPEQLVDEYVSEHLHHKGNLDDDYSDLLFTYITQARMGPVRRLVEVIESVDPT